MIDILQNPGYFCEYEESDFTTNSITLIFLIDKEVGISKEVRINLRN